MQEMSTKTQVEWRRRNVFELSSKGHSQVEIAKTADKRVYNQQGLGLSQTAIKGKH